MKLCHHLWTRPGPKTGGGGGGVQYQKNLPECSTGYIRLLYSNHFVQK